MSEPEVSERETHITAFLAQAGWGDALRISVPGDASTRRYERLSLNGTQAVLMDAPPGSDLPPEPAGATPAQRAKLGYGAQARLAGTDAAAFICIADALTTRGFSAPQILAYDAPRGLILLEDLGADLFSSVIAVNPAQEAPLYTAAVDTLAAIYRSSFGTTLATDELSWPLRDYDHTALMAEMTLMLDWFAPDSGVRLKQSALQEWETIWTESFERLTVHAPGLALRDFHAENIFWLPERDGTAQIGLIDFQDALLTHPAYDLTSLIEDIRRDVDPRLTENLKARFCEMSGLSYDDDFNAAYAVLGAQRATKLLGFPVRADLAFGKPQYRALLPRVKRHLGGNLAHPALGAVRDWYRRYVPEVLL